MKVLLKLKGKNDDGKVPREKSQGNRKFTDCGKLALITDYPTTAHDCSFSIQLVYRFINHPVKQSTNEPSNPNTRTLF